ncbi:MAG: 2-C-methyl-D-erythritol 4-phosphate cytidylyltransferase, partial [Pseudopedobacter sp.]|nr:2-C-methyl-D-erythritol 4-phosphate cytidylyltransferase [Deinococcales bacterium]
MKEGALLERGSGGAGGRIAALIPAAGSGTRLGMGFKALVDVGGKTLLERAILNLAPHVDQISIAIVPSMCEAVESLLERLSLCSRLGQSGTYRACPPPTLTEGGTTRQASVKNLLESTNAEYVLIHDAARPFLSAGVIIDMLEAIQKHGAATVALPCVDTLVRSSGELWEGLLDRSEIQAIQTPQGGRRDWLLEAHQSALAGNWSATDDAGLLARAGHTVHL